MSNLRHTKSCIIWSGAELCHLVELRKYIMWLGVEKCHLNRAAKYIIWSSFENMSFGRASEWKSWIILHFEPVLSFWLGFWIGVG